MPAVQKPIELIMARNLMASLSTPAFLVDEDGALVFYNEAAGALLGVSFDDAGKMGPEEWGTKFGPVDQQGEPIPVEDLPLVIALRQGRPAHSAFRIGSLDGAEHDIEVSAFPIITGGGSRGAISIFWPRQSDNGSEAAA